MCGFSGQVFKLLHSHLKEIIKEEFRGTKFVLYRVLRSDSRQESFEKSSARDLLKSFEEGAKICRNYRHPTTAFEFLLTFY